MHDQRAVRPATKLTRLKDLSTSRHAWLRQYSQQKPLTSNLTVVAWGCTLPSSSIARIYCTYFYQSLTDLYMACWHFLGLTLTEWTGLDAMRFRRCRATSQRFASQSFHVCSTILRFFRSASYAMLRHQPGELFVTGNDREQPSLLRSRTQAYRQS